MTKTRLGSWTFHSGNACHATLELTSTGGANISFAWKSSLTEQDRDQYACAVLPAAVRLALETVEQIAQMRLVLLQLESEGRIARVGERDGHTLWAVTEKERAANIAPRKWSLRGLWSRLQGIATSSWSPV